VCAQPDGFALRSKRGPARKIADCADRRCRCPTVVAQPGAAKLQQLHHVPVMLRCSGADPPARSHQSAVCTRLSSWGDFPIFWVMPPVQMRCEPWPVGRPGSQRSQNKDARSVSRFPLSAAAPGSTADSRSVNRLPLSPAVVRSASEVVSAAAAVDESPYVLRMSAK
jgi:hypothetical protein